MTETESVKKVRVQAYLIVLSTKHEIQIDADEVAKVVEGIKSGNVVRVRRGLFNPSYFVGVVEDKQRIERFFDDTKYDTNSRHAGVPQLKDILEGVQVKILEEGRSSIALPAPRLP